MAKILVVRFSSLGDVVLTLPVFRALRQAYPDAEIVALTKAAFGDAFANNSDVSRVMTFRPEERLRSLVRRVRDEHFDTVVDLHASLRSRVVSLLSGAKRRVTYQKAAFARRLYVGFRLANAELQRHTLDRYMDTLRRLDPAQRLFKAAALGDGTDERVVVIQTAFLGDAVLTTPLLSALHQRLPKAAITVLCTPETADVFNGQPGVREVLLYDKRGANERASIRTLARRLRDRGFTLAILPHRSLRSAIVAWLARIPRRIGFSTSQGRWLLTDVVPFEWGVHDVDRNVRLLEPLGGSAEPARLTLRPDAAAIAAVRARLQAEGVNPGDRLIGFHAGSVWATKRWLPEGFAAVADRVSQELGMRPVFVGGGKDRDATETLISRMTTKPLNWVGKTDLKELIALISLMGGFLTNDSGPMHIAVACGVPTVAIFGPTTKELGFFPYGAGHRVIEKDLPCRPCGLHGAKECPLGHFQCMRSITPDEVYAALRELAGSSKVVAL